MRSKNTFATMASVVVTAAFAGLADAAVIPLDLATNNSGSINLAGGDNTFDFEISGVQYLIVAGGGGGGSTSNNTGRRGGGGGAGGLLQGTGLTITGPQTIIVGAGGTGGVQNGAAGANGGNSSAFSLTAIGGGGGASAFGQAGGTGGSGGGAYGASNSQPGGAGTSGQGFAGGGPTNNGSGGGGAGGAAVTGANTGGIGAAYSITGSSITYATGGDAGGGSSGQVSATPAPAAANTGNGGNGITPNRTSASPTPINGQAGGTGIVVVRYDSYNDQQVFTGGTTIGQVGGDWVHQFTATGSSNLDFASNLNATIAANISGSGDLVWDNTGILTLTGDNTYAGDTIVDTGTLELADGGELLFYIGADDVNNWINDNDDVGAETLLVNGDFVFNLSSASTTAGDSWNIVDVAALTETFGGTFGVRSTVGDFIENAGVWTKSENDITYEFDESTGVLTAVIPEPASLALLGLGGLLLGKRRHG